MAFFNRIFGRKIESKDESIQLQKSDFDVKASQIAYKNCLDRIRLIVCREQLNKGRDLLYDSRALDKRPQTVSIPLQQTKSLPGQSAAGSAEPSARAPCSPSGKPPLKGRCAISKRPPPDFSLLSEAIFGNIPIQQRNSTLKIHTFTDPHRVMISKIFFTTRSSKSPAGLRQQRRSVISLVDQVDTDSSPTESRLAKNEDAVMLSLPSSLNSDSSRMSVASVPNGSFNASVGSSLSSRYMRWLASQRSQLSTTPTIAIKDRTKDDGKLEVMVGVAILLSLNGDDNSEERVKRFHRFFFAHAPVIENIVDELVFGSDGILHRSRRSVLYFMQMDEEINTRISNLFCCPRLSTPMWLTLSSCDPESKPEMIKMFVDVLVELIDTFSKSTAFLNCILTAVLSNHTYWINTVVPSRHKATRSMLMKRRAEWSAGEMRGAPYSAYSTQIMELLGSMGRSGIRRQARTVIIGRDEAVVMKLLYVISYYIRSCVVSPNQIEPMDLLASEKCIRPEEDTALRSSVSSVSSENVECMSNTLLVEEDTFPSKEPCKPPSEDCFEPSPGSGLFIPLIPLVVRRRPPYHFTVLCTVDGPVEADSPTSHASSVDQRIDNNSERSISEQAFPSSGELTPVQPECYVDTQLINLALSMFGGYCRSFLPDLILQGCSDLNLTNSLLKAALSRQWLAATAQTNAERARWSQQIDTASLRSSSSHAEGLCALRRKPSPSSYEQTDCSSTSSAGSPPNLRSVESDLRLTAAMNLKAAASKKRDRSVSETTEFIEGPTTMESVFIVADVETETVSLCTSKSSTVQMVKPSASVGSMLQLARCLRRLSLPAEFVLHSLEDCLQKLYLAGKSVHDMSRVRKTSIAEGAALLGIDAMDLPLHRAISDVLSFEEDAVAHLCQANFLEEKVL